RPLTRQRRLDGSPLRRREHSEHLWTDGRQQVAEPRIGKLQLARRGTCHEEPQPRRRRLLERRAHDRRLADPRLAFDHERRYPTIVPSIRGADRRPGRAVCGSEPTNDRSLRLDKTRCSPWSPEAYPLLWPQAHCRISTPYEEESGDGGCDDDALASDHPAGL